MLKFFLYISIGRSRRWYKSVVAGYHIEVVAEFFSLDVLGADVESLGHIVSGFAGKQARTVDTVHGSFAHAAAEITMGGSGGGGFHRRVDRVQ